MDSGVKKMFDRLDETNEVGEQDEETPEEDQDIQEQEESETPPVVQNIDRQVINDETGTTMPLDEFQSIDGDDFAEGLQPEKLQDPQQAIEWLQEQDRDLAFPPADEFPTVRALEQWLIQEQGWTSDNTYNWGWWGPDVNFSVSPDDELLIFKISTGGDPRGGYKDYWGCYIKYFQSAPFFTWRLSMTIDTDEGQIALDPEDQEAYRFTVVNDETNTFRRNETYEPDEIERMLDMSEFGGFFPF